MDIIHSLKLIPQKLNLKISKSGISIMYLKILKTSNGLQSFILIQKNLILIPIRITRPYIQMEQWL